MYLSNEFNIKAATVKKGQLINLVLSGGVYPEDILSLSIEDSLSWDIHVDSGKAKECGYGLTQVKSNGIVSSTNELHLLVAEEVGDIEILAVNKRNAANTHAFKVHVI